MKIVVTGKGGAGKTTVAGALARHLARHGQRVVALDCDPAPTWASPWVWRPIRWRTSRRYSTAWSLRGGPITATSPTPKSSSNASEWTALTCPAGRGSPHREPSWHLHVLRVPCHHPGDLRRPLRRRQGGGRRLEGRAHDLRWARPGPDDKVVVVAEPSTKSIEIARRAGHIWIAPRRPWWPSPGWPMLSERRAGTPGGVEAPTYRWGGGSRSNGR